MEVGKLHGSQFVNGMRPDKLGNDLFVGTLESNGISIIHQCYCHLL